MAVLRKHQPVQAAGAWVGGRGWAAVDAQPRAARAARPGGRQAERGERVPGMSQACRVWASTHPLSSSSSTVASYHRPSIHSTSMRRPSSGASLSRDRRGAGASRSCARRLLARRGCCWAGTAVGCLCCFSSACSGSAGSGTGTGTAAPAACWHCRRRGSRGAGPWAGAVLPCNPSASTGQEERAVNHERPLNVVSARCSPAGGAGAAPCISRRWYLN